MELIKDISLIRGELPIIAMPEYFKALGAWDFGYIIDEKHILPFYIKRKAIFHYLIFTTGVLGASFTSEEEKCFLTRVVQFIKSKKIADFILMNHVTALFNAVPENSRYCEFGSYVLDLILSEEELFARLHTKHRNVIKKAIKDEVTIKEGKDYQDICIKLIRNTMMRQGITPPPASFYSHIGDCLASQLDYWVAFDAGGEAHGSAILIWNNAHSSYYLFGGSCESPHTGAMNLLQWKAILKMKERGVMLYDFVGARIHPISGSKYEGIQRFKSRFGGELIQGYLWKMPINSFKYNIYKFLVNLRSRLKGQIRVLDIIDQETDKGD